MLQGFRFFNLKCLQFSTTTQLLKPVIRRRKPRLPLIPMNLTPSTVEEAVDNLLYSAPTADKSPSTRHTLNCLVANEPGVLSRVSGILAARAINIVSLVVARTEVPDLSRMTIVIHGKDDHVEQARFISIKTRRQLEDVVACWAVLDYTKAEKCEREMLLVKVAIVPHEYEAEDSLPLDTSDNHQHGLTSLLASSMQRQSISELANLFGAKVIDVSLDSVIVELTAKPSRVDAFVELLKPYGILEAARSGSMAMRRSILETTDEDEVEEDSESVDATLLPPG